MQQLIKWYIANGWYKRAERLKEKNESKRINRDTAKRRSRRTDKHSSIQR